MTYEQHIHQARLEVVTARSKGEPVSPGTLAWTIHAAETERARLRGIIAERDARIFELEADLALTIGTINTTAQ